MLMSGGFEPGREPSHLRAGIKAVLDKHKQGAKMTVHFRADLSGLLHPESADAAVETVEEYEVKVPVKEPAKDQPEAGKSSAEDAAAAGAGADQVPHEQHRLGRRGCMVLT